VDLQAGRPIPEQPGHPWWTGLGRFRESNATRRRDKDATASVLWTPGRRRAVGHALLWLVAVPYAFIFVVGAFTGFAGFDAHAYWAAWSNGLYSASPEQRDAYLYSPAFAEVLGPLSLLPWSVFYGFWVMVTGATFAWLLAPLGRRWGLPLFVLAIPEIIVGNIWGLLALVVVFGFRYPGAWAFPLLTKITPAVGPLWFAVRREWRAFAASVGLALAVALASVAFAPHLWIEWARLLVHPDQYANPDRASATSLVSVPLFARLPLAACLTIFAARTNRRLLLPFAMVLASPVFAINTFLILTALPRMARQGRPESQE
jgi:glycosyl transferase family 87